MVCALCGATQFVAAEYKLDSGWAPALQCANCGALELDEALARSEEERESVRLAKAARDAQVTVTKK